jgi:hypothetical protein
MAFKNLISTLPDGPSLRPRYPERLTRAGAVLAERIERSGRPVTTPYELFRAIRFIYADGRGLYLRKTEPDLADYVRLRKNLMDCGVLASDPDYGRRAFRILDNPDLPADDICCLVDPFCYISHLSAMQRYGLTNRRPEALHLSRPAARILGDLAIAAMLADQGTNLPMPADKAVRLHAVRHPPRVRKRKVQLFQTARPGQSIANRSGFSRIATIGQTFLDTLDNPDLCGGMVEVLEIWTAHAGIYVDDIVAAVDRHESGIVKIRAGYILDEMLGISDERIQAWRRFAQRGGSRLLDPAKVYAPRYSEKWMISLNA